ncbi:type III secreted protein BopD [Bordetella bronchiseptica 99-R-0433]|uniref:type III secretion system translocon subunit SctB n=1 Tax=Bordetella bronchiseptica TaxID=518 RepID=UPI00045A380C|nr:type III secretion system translocon subunit SctB [Bordetella bronchiseptica]KCV60475.1 type III secreted protein BopD [Bordetella bronchiseptica 99-R-0433]
MSVSPTSPGSFGAGPVFDAELQVPAASAQRRGGAAPVPPPVDRRGVEPGDPALGMLPVPDLAASDAISRTRAALDDLDAAWLGEDIYALMAVLQQASQQMREAARVARDAEATRQTQALGDAASQMRQAANERMAGAIVAGAMQMAGGLVQLGAGLAAGVQAMGGAAAQAKGAAFSEQASTSRKVAAGLHDAPELQATVQARAAQFEAQAASFGADAARSSAKSQRVSSVAQAGAAAAGGVGGLTGAAQERRAAEHEARRAELEVEAKVHETASRRADEAMQQMLDIIRGIREKLAGMEQSRSETARSVARNI